MSKSLEDLRVLKLNYLITRNCEPKDAQSKYCTARAYKSHLDSVAKDRQLEEFLQAISWVACVGQP